MNPVAEQFPVFPNIYAAMSCIKRMLIDIHKDPLLRLPDWELWMEPVFVDRSQFDLDDFIFTRISPNRDDLQLCRILNIDDGRPFLEDYKRFSLKPCLFNSKCLFRGQSKDYGSIKPNLFRQGSKAYFLDDMIRVNELTAFLAQHPLIQLLGIKGVNVAGKNIKLQANLYGLAEHYYQRATLVDLTSSLDIASFFATTSYDWDNDRYLPLELDEKSEGVLYVLPIYTALTYNLRFGFQISSIGKQFTLHRPGRQLGFFADVPLGKDLVDHPFLLKFRFKHNKALSRQIYNSFGKGLALAPPDFLHRYWKPAREDKDKPFKVSEKAIELNVFNNHGETRDSIVNKLKSYRLKNGQPMFELTGREWPDFPEEIVKEFREAMSNGWWEDEFCSDIYGMPSARFRSAFLSLRSII